MDLYLLYRLPILLAFFANVFIPHNQMLKLRASSCECECDPQRDSAILMDLYWATGGADWNTAWDINAPYLEWETNTGLDLVNGCVFSLELQQNNLRGELPISIGGLCNMKEFLLYDNGDELGGPIPSSIGDLCNLETLNLNGNNFNGAFPEEIANCTKLKELLIVENEFNGPFPNLSGLELTILDISHNSFSFFSDHSNIISWRPEDFAGCQVDNNLLSFDDFIPNMPIANLDVQWVYSPQKLLFKDTTIILHEGSSRTIDLGFDAGVNPASTYTWFKNGAPLPNFIFNENKISFLEVSEADEGDYHCEITNPAVDLILETHLIRLKVCQPSSGARIEMICANEIFEIEGMTFDSEGSYEVMLDNIEGCDSTLFLELIVRGGEEFGYANAGMDRVICEQGLTLEGNFPAQPYNYVGLWTALSSPGISSSGKKWENPPLLPGENIFTWTLSNEHCLAYDTDTVSITILPQPIALNDTFFYSESELELLMQLDANDILPEGIEWTLELNATDNDFEFEKQEKGTFLFTIPRLASGKYAFSYELCNEVCSNCTTGEVYVLPIEDNSIAIFDKIPEVITPNGDGINDRFVVPPLEYQKEQYPNSELIVKNRRGIVVFYAKPYQNDWEGLDRNGVPLPGDNYFYYLKLNEILIKRGNLLLINGR